MISLFGSAIQRFCMSLYVLELTGSPGIFATILSISMLPYVLLAPVAGNITDSFSKKKIMVCTDIFSGIVISCYAVFLFSGHDRPAVIAVTMILLSSASTVYSPAVTASILCLFQQNSFTGPTALYSRSDPLPILQDPSLRGCCMVFWGFVGSSF